MRILVTGGAGYIGSHTVKLLLARGHDVRVSTTSSYGHRAAVPAERLIVARPGRRRRPSTICSLAHRIEAVVHFAAFAYVGESVTHPAKYYQNNLVNTPEPARPVPPARRQPVRLLQHLRHLRRAGQRCRSPRTTPQRPINPYGHTKLAVEQALADYAAAYGLGYAALRYFNAAGAAADGDDRRGPRPRDAPDPARAPGRARPAAAHRGLRHRLPDARRHLHPRLHPRR